VSQDETQREVRTGTALSALSLAGIGLSLLVAPKEVAGALLLVKKGVVCGGSPAYWALTGLYILGSVFVGYLTLFSSRLRGR
jgi:hypothetical protein